MGSNHLGRRVGRLGRQNNTSRRVSRISKAQIQVPGGGGRHLGLAQASRRAKGTGTGREDQAAGGVTASHSIERFIPCLVDFQKRLEPFSKRMTLSKCAGRVFMHHLHKEYIMDGKASLGDVKWIITIMRKSTH